MESKLIINIATYPQSELSNDTKLAKASVLYADHVNLFSPTASIFTSLEMIKDLSFKEKIILTSELMKVFEKDKTNYSEGLIKTYLFLENKKHRNKKELQTFLQIKNSINELVNGVLKLSSERGGNELYKLIKSERLSLKYFDANMISNDKDFDKYFEEEYLNNLKQMLTEDNNYPLFDEGISSLVNSAIKEGVIDVSARNIITGKRAGLATGILLYLPNFEKATVDEILDIRKELEKPLVFFRSAVIEITEKIKNEQWTNDFSYDIEDIVNSKIKPALIEIEELIKENSYLRRLTEGLFQDINSKDLINIIGLGLIGIGISAISPLIDLSKTPLYLLGGFGIHAIKQFVEYEKNLTNIKKNSFYFVYHVQKKLQ